MGIAVEGNSTIAVLGGSKELSILTGIAHGSGIGMVAFTEKDIDVPEGGMTPEEMGAPILLAFTGPVSLDQLIRQLTSLRDEMIDRILKDAASSGVVH